MLDKLGTTGIFGLLCVLAGIVVVAWKAPVVAAGIALVLVGLLLLVRRGYRAGMQMMGMA